MGLGFGKTDYAGQIITGHRTLQMRILPTVRPVCLPEPWDYFRLFHVTSSSCPSHGLFERVLGLLHKVCII